MAVLTQESGPVATVGQSWLKLAASSLLGAMTLAVATTACNSANEREWDTYTSESFSFALEYPRHWNIEVSGPVTQELVFFDVRLTGPEDEIIAAVNFQGGWCETGSDYVETRIEVNGIPGVHYECSSEPGSPPAEMVRYFQGAKGQRNYTVLNLGVSDVDTTRRIIESFRFLD